MGPQQEEGRARVVEETEGGRVAGLQVSNSWRSSRVG